MKKLVFLVTTVCLALTLGTGASVTAAVKPPEGTIKILVDGATKPAVPFDHKAHLAAEKGPKECAACHHKGVEKEEDIKCTSCHGLEDQGEVVRIKDAMHKKDKGACYSCHFGKEASAKKLKCSDCHVKE